MLEVFTWLHDSLGIRLRWQIREEARGQSLPDLSWQRPVHGPLFRVDLRRGVEVTKLQPWQLRRRPLPPPPAPARLFSFHLWQLASFGLTILPLRFTYYSQLVTDSTYYHLHTSSALLRQELNMFAFLVPLLFAMYLGGLMDYPCTIPNCAVSQLSLLREAS